MYTKSGLDAEGNDIRGKAEFIVAKHRSGATDTVNLRFVKEFARFENEGDSFNLTGETTYESKMNTGDPSAGPSMANDGFTPPPPNVDFMQGPEEQPSPF